MVKKGLRALPKLPQVRAEAGYLILATFLLLFDIYKGHKQKHLLIRFGVSKIRNMLSLLVEILF